MALILIHLEFLFSSPGVVEEEVTANNLTHIVGLLQLGQNIELFFLTYQEI